MDGPELSRRQFGLLAAGAIAKMATGAKAEVSEIVDIEIDKEIVATKSLRKLQAPGNEKAYNLVSSYKFWDETKEGHMSPEELHAKFLEESEMCLPSASDFPGLQKKHSDIIREWGAKIPKNKHGLFLDGDSQTLFVIHKDSGGKLALKKKYPVVTSYNDWSDRENSRGTPVGATSIKEKREGLFGQVISTLNKHADDSKNFETLPIKEGSANKSATFVKGITLKTQPVPEVITAALLLDPARGIWIHGSPRKGLAEIPPEKRRDTAGSTGCVRASNHDVMDMMQYVEIGTPVYIYGRNPARESDLGWVKFK